MKWSDVDVYWALRAQFTCEKWNCSIISEIMSKNVIFGDAFWPRTHISAHSGKTGRRSSNLTWPRWKRTQCSTVWFLFELSTMNIKDSTGSWNIVNYRHVMWPLTLTFDLNRKCLYKLSMRDASIINMQCFVTLGQKMRKMVVLRVSAIFASRSSASPSRYLNTKV